MQTEFLGECMGVRLIPRGGVNDQHILIELLVEDDGIRHPKHSFSSYWLDEMIEVLRNARRAVRRQAPDMVRGKQVGWKFK